jgi:hypothetical protein
MTRILVALLFAVSAAHCQKPADATGSAQRPVNDVRRYSPSAAAGKLGRGQETFWDFWLRQFNPQGTDYGALLEEKRRKFLAQAGANPYFWFAFAELAAVCFLLLWVAKQRIDRRELEWEAAGCMADLANYAHFCKQHAVDAIAKHNEHIELCNRLIESEETGKPVPPGGVSDEQRQTIDRLQKELADKVADNRRLEAELTSEKSKMRNLTTRLDALEQARGAANGGAGNVDLVNRLNAAVSEVQSLKRENERLKKGHAHAGGSDRSG